MSKFYMLVGAPGSGKSTWTRNHLSKSDEEYVIISSDDIIVEMARLIDPSLNYSQAFKAVNQREVQKELDRRVSDAILNDKNIIWDQTNMSAKARAAKIKRIPKAYRKICVVFMLEREELDRRLQKRSDEEGKHIPAFVVNNMLDSFEEPDLNEGFNQIIRV